MKKRILIIATLALLCFGSLVFGQNSNSSTTMDPNMNMSQGNMSNHNMSGRHRRGRRHGKHRRHRRHKMKMKMANMNHNM